MKKRHLLLGLFALLSMVQARADVEINETNFPDADFRSYLLSESYGSDGVITNAEIAEVTSIDVSLKNIASLKGIEFFTALTTLNCLGNQLTALDVSKNTALTMLSCYENQLTALDVTKNTALNYLICHYNQLTALDVSKNTALTYLDCANNQLTALDVTNNTALDYLICTNNQLTALDVSKNTALTALICLGNQLTALDVTNITALTYLRCYQNKIKGAAMDALVSSLPTQSNASLYVIYNENEGNVMTTTQVAAAKAKGWVPYYCVSSTYIPEWDYYTYDWQEYAGSDPTAIEGIESDTSACKSGSDVYFDLSGRRVMAPQKGVYVKNGKKVVVK